MFVHKCKQRKHNKLIRIVCATQVPLNEFDNTMLGRSLHAHDQLFDLDIYVEPENTRPLASVYNEVIDISTTDPATLVFVHDDVCILDWFWGHTLHASLQKFDIVGLAGTTRRHPRQAIWCRPDVELKQFEHSDYLSGTVSHGMSMPPADVSSYGIVGKKCVLMDGLFLACESHTLTRTDLRFDPQFAFHFYDMDFCRQAEQMELTMGTAAISVIHGNGDGFNPGWHTAYKEYIRKWGS